MAKKYVRITPRDKRSGALAERVTVGGRVFEAGQWYTLSEKWCDKIAGLRQDGGAPYFQIMSEEQFRATAQAETLALMRAQGIAGLAAQGAIPSMPMAHTHKSGPKESAFAGLEDESEEVSMAEPVQPVAPAPDPAAPLVSEPIVADRDDGEDDDSDDDDGWPDDDA